jgi:hypothetical protein
VANTVTVEIIENNSQVVLEEETVEIVIGETGPQGPAGTLDYGLLGYTHVQNSASTTWSITHGLGFTPNITVVDSGGTVVEGSYNYPNANTVVLTFSSSFSGKAYLS